ncbi:MAG TPA: hypothetical protein VM285_00670, partial [Polyangia bacterium]|nr:hypothetical protein [Polyangia bacterium]
MPDRYRALVAATVVALALACGSCGDKSADAKAAALPAPAHSAVVAPDAGKLLAEGYELKRDGHNGAALEKFGQACAALEGTVGPRDHLLASCYDDKAMIMIRMGRYDESRALYETGRKVLEK